MKNETNQKKQEVEIKIVLDYIDNYMKNINIDYSTFRYIDVEYSRENFNLIIKMGTVSDVKNKIILTGNIKHNTIEYVNILDKDVCLFDVCDVEEIKMAVIQKIYLSYYGMSVLEKDLKETSPTITQYKLDEYEMCEEDCLE